MFQQSVLNVVGRHLLVTNHLEDTSLVELVGYEVLIVASGGLHLRIGIDSTLQQQSGSYGHIEVVHVDIALQCGQRIVGTITAYGTFQTERALAVFLAVAQDTGCYGTTL